MCGMRLLIIASPSAVVYLELEIGEYLHPVNMYDVVAKLCLNINEYLSVNKSGLRWVVMGICPGMTACNIHSMNYLWHPKTGNCFGHGPLTRYVKLRVAHAPGMPGAFSQPPTSKETAS